jgi:hypothetical protein
MLNHNTELYSYILLTIVFFDSHVSPFPSFFSVSAFGFESPLVQRGGGSGLRHAVVQVGTRF